MEEGSEKDSGTGDSKRSYEQDMEPSIVGQVMKKLVSARGEAGEWGALPPVDQTATSMSDLDTGISSLGDSTLQSIQPSLTALHRRGCPRLRSIPPPPSSSHPPPSSTSSIPTGGEVAVLGTSSLAVDNPLYDQLPCRSVEGVASAPASEAASPPASIISDSVAYCGRFPATDSSHCRQCGEPRRLCGHVSEVESVSSARSSTMARTDLPITFNTFQPFRVASNHDRPSDAPPSEAGSGREERRKRLSAIELPTGETYLSIESPATMATSITVEKDLGLVAREYRGGGTLPRHGLQQEWLEASLAPAEPPVKRRSRERSSRRSFLRSSKRYSGERGERGSAKEEQPALFPPLLEALLGGA